MLGWVPVVAWGAAVLFPTSVGAAIGPHEVLLPDPAATPDNQLTWCAIASLCPHPGNYERESPLPGGNERNSMKLKVRGGTYPYSASERMFASFGYPESTGYDRYRVEAEIGPDGQGKLGNASGNFRFVPFVCFEPTSGGSPLCNTAVAAVEGGSTPPYNLSLLTVAGELGYRTRVGWRFAGTAGNRSPTADTYKMTARLRWYGVDESRPVIRQRMPAPGNPAAAPGGSVAAETFDAGAGMRRAELTIDGQLKAVTEAASAGPRVGTEEPEALRVEYVGDLTDGAHTATVVATDWTGWQASDSWGFCQSACPTPPVSYPLAYGQVRLTTRVRSRGRTEIRGLVIRSIAPSYSVRVRCTGRGCRRSVSGTFRPRRGANNVSLNRRVRGMRLRKGSRLSIRLSAQGSRSSVHVFQMRRGRSPTFRLVCYQPGSNVKASCD